MSPSRIAALAPPSRSENDFTQFRQARNTSMRSMALALRFEAAIVSRLWFEPLCRNSKSSRFTANSGLRVVRAARELIG